MTAVNALAAPGRTSGGPRERIRFDVIAGLITAAVVVPKALAYASIAGLPVRVGLTTALVPMVIYAVLGTSRVLSVSTTTTIAILTAAALSAAAPDGDPATLVRAAAVLALLAGSVLVGASFLRLGFVADFISEPVLVGFKAGIGLVIVLDQIPKLLGVHFPKTGFFRNIAAIVRSMPETSMPTLARRCRDDCSAPGARAISAKVAGAARRRRRRDRRDGPVRPRRAGRRSHRDDPAGLPSPVLPDLSLLGRGSGRGPRHRPDELHRDDRRRARVLPERRAAAPGQPGASRDGPRQRRRSFFGAMPAGGGTSQTAVNRRAGARTQLAELVTAGATLVTMLILAPWIGLMPQATLAAVVIVYSIGLIQPCEFRAILDVRRTSGPGPSPRSPASCCWGRSRDPRRDRRVARRSRPPDGQSAGPGPRAKARHQHLPAALEGAPGRRDLSGPAAPAARRAGFLRECGPDRREDANVRRRGESEGDPPSILGACPTSSTRR